MKTQMPSAMFIQSAIWAACASTVASAQTAENFPKASEILAPAIQGVIALNGSNAALSGSLKGKKDTDYADTDLSINGLTLPINLTGKLPLGEGGEAKALFSVLSYADKSTRPFSGLPSENKNTATAFSAGLQTYYPLSTGWYALAGGQLMHTSLRNRFTVENNPDQAALSRLVDGKFFNYRIGVVSVLANAQLGYRTGFFSSSSDEPGGVSGFVQGGILPLWSKTTSVNDAVQEFSRSSTAGLLKAGVEWNTARQIEGKPVLLAVNATRHQFSNNARAFDGNYLNEVSLDVLRLEGRSLGQPIGNGFSLGYLSGPNVQGWRAQLKLSFD